MFFYVHLSEELLGNKIIMLFAFIQSNICSAMSIFQHQTQEYSITGTCNTAVRATATNNSLVSAGKFPGELTSRVVVRHEVLAEQGRVLTVRVARTPGLDTPSTPPRSALTYPPEGFGRALPFSIVVIMVQDKNLVN